LKRIFSVFSHMTVHYLFVDNAPFFLKHVK